MVALTGMGLHVAAVWLPVPMELSGHPLAEARIGRA